MSVQEPRVTRYDANFFACPPDPKTWYQVSSQCHGAPDCVGGDEHTLGFTTAMCNALAFVALHEKRKVLIYDAKRTRLIATVTQNWNRGPRVQRCKARAGGKPDEPGADAGPDPFTIDVPGIQDIIKVKDWESKALRKERYDRFKSARSGVPDFLKHMPPLLTKIDDAQDLLFTALAIAWPILKFLPKAFLGPVGFLLTINDVLNMVT